MEKRLNLIVKKMEKGPISQFITHHYRHFNSAALVDAAKAFDEHMNKGGKMMLAMAGAMSTAELGLSLAEMIRQDKFQIVSCSANNLDNPSDFLRRCILSARFIVLLLLSWNLFSSRS